MQEKPFINLFIAFFPALLYGFLLHVKMKCRIQDVNSQLYIKGQFLHCFLQMCTFV